MTFRHLLLASALALGPFCVPPPATAATAQAAITEFSVAPGPLSAALRDLAAQSGVRLLFDSAAVAPFRTEGVRGRMTVEDALQRLLAGSGLSAERTGRDVWVIRAAPRQASAAPAKPTLVDEVVVTGTLLRGANGPSPLVVLSRDDIDRAGHASVAQALAALPQNHGGTGNEAALQNGADSSAVNVSYASGVNLRGLGSDSTLVLVNGRRMAGSGAKADFADVSTLPTAAVERIEVLLDGASALYGSDAVGGVVNIILAREFEGGETRMRVGGIEDSPSGEFAAAQTFGRRWSGGGGLISYEYLDREALPASARPRAGDADLRRFGGTDRRQIYSHPGNIVVYDPAIGGYAPRYAIPSGQDGSALRPEDFVAGAINLENPRAGMNVLGRQVRHALFGAVHHAFGDRLVLSADVRAGRRTWDTVGSPASTVLTVDTRNPHFVSPEGAASHQIAYSFGDEVGTARITGTAESLGASVGADLELGGTWAARGYLAWARETSDGRFTNQINSAFLNEALGRATDNPATPYSAARDGWFNPFGDGAANASAVLDFISSGETRSTNRASVATANLQIDGAAWSLPAGDLRLAFGVNARRETQADGGFAFTSTVAPSPYAPRSGARTVWAAFAEARVPLIGPEAGLPGIERLEASLAVRHERYDDIGGTTNPKFGLIWTPAASWRVRATYGTSFRAPALIELNERPVNSPSLLPRGASQTVTLLRYGGNPGLEPETAASWTAGIEFRPTSRPGLRLAVTGFGTTFENRIGRPVLDNVLNALNDPALAPFIRLVSPGSDPADRAFVQALLDDPATQLGALFPADAYGAVADARYVNTDALEVAGVDVDGRYAFDHGENRFSLGLNLSRLTRYAARSTPTSPTVSRLDTPHNPLGLRGRLSLDWFRGAWGAGATLIRAGGYRDLDGRAIDPWTTVDAQVRFAPDDGRWAGLEVRLSVRNLADADPPVYDAPQGLAYDAANADVLGRTWALQVTRRW